MTDRELMRHAMDALEDACGGRCNAENNPCWQRDIANALSDRLAQPEQEPVAWTERELELINGMIGMQLHHAEQCDHIPNRKMAEKQKGWDMERVTLLQKVKATTPPQRPWVGLTDEEIIDLIHPLVMADMAEKATDYEISRAIEAKLKEKNT